MGKDIQEVIADRLLMIANELKRANDIAEGMGGSPSSGEGSMKLESSIFSGDRRSELDTYLEGLEILKRGSITMEDIEYNRIDPIRVPAELQTVGEVCEVMSVLLDQHNLIDYVEYENKSSANVDKSNDLSEDFLIRTKFNQHMMDVYVMVSYSEGAINVTPYM